MACQEFLSHLCCTARFGAFIQKLWGPVTPLTEPQIAGRDPSIPTRYRSEG